ncbi:MAG TPA: DUF6519 domain-containing protein [Streptosporangiaceae bacterium]
MKADLSRVTFDPTKRFSGVVYQQGRVVLDADLNEEHEIESYTAETEATDVIGPSGAPKAGAGGGFQISVTADGSNLLISPGRIYAGGVLCELTPTEVPVDAADVRTVKVPTWHLDGHDLDTGQWVEVLLPGQPSGEVRLIRAAAPKSRTLTLSPDLSGIPAPGSRLRRATTYDTQPDSFAALADVTQGKAGRYRVYLDVYERLLTQVEDVSILESALGGVDTAARTKIVWQVRVGLAGPAAQGDCSTLFAPPWAPVSPTGTMRAQVDPGAAATPCVLPPTAGFTGLQNQLYRVEVRVERSDGGIIGSIDDPGVSFLWQRDNGTVVAPVTDFGRITTVSSLGRDGTLALADGQLVEALDDRLELAGQPGELFTITVDEEHKQVTLDRAPQVMLDHSAHPKLRRWDGQSAITSPPTPQAWTKLEKGLEVQFLAGTFRHGDYWLIPARTATTADIGTIDWPLDDDKQPFATGPDGNRHHYAPLALVDFDGAKFLPAAGTQLLDCRAVFPPLTAITAGDVSYDGSACSLNGALNVQQAIEALCAAREDMCTVHVSPGDGWESAFAQIANGQDAQICFEVGNYKASSTVTLANKGHLTLCGCGPGTKINAPGQEAVFRFTGCPSVTVRDLSAAGGVAATGQDQEGLLGALTFSSCSQVRIEDVVLSCASQGSKAATCVSVIGDPGDPVSSARIEHCDLTVGQHQVGILVTDTARTHIEDNIVRTAGQPFSTSAVDWMRAAPLRAAVRDMLIRPPQAAAPPAGPARAPAAAAAVLAGPGVALTKGSRRTPATVTVQGAAGQISFGTVNAIAPVVASVLGANPPGARLTGRAITEHVRSVVDRALRQDSAIVGGGRLFQWAGQLVARNPVVCEQGIVVGGRSAAEVRILQNTVVGAMQGIHVGLSHRGAARAATDAAGRVTIFGNTLEIRLPAIGLRDRHAIFVGSADSVLVKNNYGIRAASGQPASVSVEAIRVFGMLGRRAILRENHFEGFTIGFIFHPLNNPATRAANLWVIADNVAAGANPVVQIPVPNPARVQVSNNLA